MQELWFLCPACGLMLIDTYMKFLEDILNKFQVTERTRFCASQNSKENNSKSVNSRIMADWYLYDVLRKQLERFSSYRADSILWQESKGNN